MAALPNFVISYPNRNATVCTRKHEALETVSQNIVKYFRPEKFY
jgi:hypothetical protein